MLDALAEVVLTSVSPHLPAAVLIADRWPLDSLSVAFFRNPGTRQVNDLEPCPDPTEPQFRLQPAALGGDRCMSLSAEGGPGGQSQFLASGSDP